MTNRFVVVSPMGAVVGPFTKSDADKWVTSNPIYRAVQYLPMKWPDGQIITTGTLGVGVICPDGTKYIYGPFPSAGLRTEWLNTFSHNLYHYWLCEVVVAP